MKTPRDPVFRLIRYTPPQSTNVLPDAPFNCENQASETSAKGGDVQFKARAGVWWRMAWANEFLKAFRISMCPA